LPARPSVIVQGGLDRFTYGINSFQSGWVLQLSRHSTLPAFAVRAVALPR
jgi:hypothetical protein